MNLAVGRRDRKKASTRESIEAVALEMFLRHGFDNVTVAQIAEAADVAPQTVFNHFRSKEDLVFTRLEAFEDQLLAAVRDRPAGASVVRAFREALLARQGLLGRDDPAAREQLSELSRMIDGSATLREREQRVFRSRTDELASMLSAEGLSGVAPWVVANALIGVHRALIATIRRGLLAGESPSRLAEDASREVARALDLLDHGFSTL